MQGIWYLAEDGKKIGEVIYIKDTIASRRKTPFLISGISEEVEIIRGITYRQYYIIQPNRRKGDPR